MERRVHIQKNNKQIIRSVIYQQIHKTFTIVILQGCSSQAMEQITCSREVKISSRAFATKCSVGQTFPSCHRYPKTLAYGNGDTSYTTILNEVTPNTFCWFFNNIFHGIFLFLFVHICSSYGGWTENSNVSACGGWAFFREGPPPGELSKFMLSPTEVYVAGPVSRRPLMDRVG